MEVVSGMEPASIIVTVLVRLLLPGAQAVAQRAMTDGYEALKTVLLRRYGHGLGTSIAELEHAPTSPDVQRRLATDLHAVGADRDAEILALARQLSDLIELGSDEAAPRPVVAVQRRAGVQAVSQLLDRHVDRVHQIRSQHRVEDTDLLTGVDTRNLPRTVRDDLGQLHDRIRSVIETIAQRIEDGEYLPAEQAITSLRIGLAERERAERLIRADKQLHISYQTLRLAVEFFSDFNQQVLTKIERETSADRLATMMFGNAIMIYELTDFVISYIDGFIVRGASDIQQVHSDAVGRIAKLREEQERLVEQAQSSGIEPIIREQTLADVAARRSAIDTLDTEWSAYIGEVERFGGMIDEVRAKVPTLRLIRDNAKVQISTLQAVEQLRFLKRNTDAIRGTVAAIQNFRLAPLTSHRVRRLLNI